MLLPGQAHRRHLLGVLRQGALRDTPPVQTQSAGPQKGCNEHQQPRCQAPEAAPEDDAAEQSDDLAKRLKLRRLMVFYAFAGVHSEVARMRLVPLLRCQDPSLFQGIMESLCFSMQLVADKAKHYENVTVTLTATASSPQCRGADVSMAAGMVTKAQAENSEPCVSSVSPDPLYHGAVSPTATVAGLVFEIPYHPA